MTENLDEQKKVDGRRTLTYAGLTVIVLVLIVCVIGAVAVYRNWALIDTFAFILGDLEAAQIQPQNAEDMLVYLETYPEQTALVVYSANADGSVNLERDVLVHNGDLVLPLASTIKIVLLGTYAQAVDEGRIAPDDVVTMAEWERYYLPGTDGGAHVGVLDELQIDHQNGLAIDPAETVTLDQLVHAMIRFSDNAATDLLLELLGPAAVDDFIVEAGLQNQEPFLSLSGLFLSWTNHEQPLLNGDRAAELVAMSPAELQAELDSWDEKMANDLWRAEEQSWRIDGPPLPSLRHQYVVAQLAAGGSANDYARIMALVATDQLISPEASALMRSHLDWPMDNAPISADYADFGTKGGSLAGILTEASYSVPRRGEFADETRVVVLFMNDIPGTPFGIMAQSFAGQDLQRELMTDPGMVERASAALGQ